MRERRRKCVQTHTGALQTGRKSCVSMLKAYYRQAVGQPSTRDCCQVVLKAYYREGMY